MNGIRGWLEHRTGIGSLLHEALYERIPGGARWRYVWGSTLVFAFVVQAVTGVFLWMAYSPSSRTAWESVYYIQYEMQGGWLLRGIHHFMAQAMVVLLALHLLQVVIDGAYRAPREINFWIGLLLMFIVLALALTGYLLPWDQKGFWATTVATNLASQIPGVGVPLQNLLVGGASYGHHTLTRFFALHAGVLPGLLILLLAGHLALFRRHGLTTRPSKIPDQYFWPDQLLRDAVACLAVLAVVLLLNLRGLLSPHDGLAAGAFLGADLGSPADPSEQYAAARPEWYFLFLYQMLKYFEGGRELLGVLVIPSAVAVVLFLMPLVGRWRLGHGFNIAVVIGLIMGAIVLTALAWQEDRNHREYLVAYRQAEKDAQRIKQVIARRGGIPPEGVLSLMQSDPEIQGPRLFAQHCQSCHSYVDSQGRGLAGPPASQEGVPDGGPNLYDFASREWLTGLLDPEKITSDDYFGRTIHAEGEMAMFVTDSLSDLDSEGQQKLKDAIVTLSAQAKLRRQAEADRKAQQEGVMERGMEAITLDFACTDCHKLGEEGFEGTGPDLTGYGSQEWLEQMIANPAHERFYGENNDRMPVFADPDQPSSIHQLTAEQIRILARWIRGDDR
jgi:ubiquinol-cytochrome c reductase cytochrome b subunit